MFGADGGFARWAGAVDLEPLVDARHMEVVPTRKHPQLVALLELLDAD
eukprot:CAMPEP_0198208622 /NCGR_PEP_ID=MMETSP1445-20131203/11961_1 /TAXON_ID=36898 /ORGANISM="Pyramimonas sp., Strain CCMP2087" /LENGTH=47 /DNA_ID= /DNA_START= /DNA_END= /DNA_ORIENTATION=